MPYGVPLGPPAILHAYIRNEVARLPHPAILPEPQERRARSVSVATPQEYDPTQKGRACLIAKNKPRLLTRTKEEHLIAKMLTTVINWSLASWASPPRARPTSYPSTGKLLGDVHVILQREKGPDIRLRAGYRYSRSTKTHSAT